MLQRTLITNKADELSACMEEIGALPEFGSGGDKLLLFSAPGADGETLKARIASVRRALPPTAGKRDVRRRAGRIRSC